MQRPPSDVVPTAGGPFSVSQPWQDDRTTAALSTTRSTGPCGRDPAVSQQESKFERSPGRPRFSEDLGIADPSRKKPKEPAYIKHPRVGAESHRKPSKPPDRLHPGTELPSKSDPTVMSSAVPPVGMVPPKTEVNPEVGGG